MAQLKGLIDQLLTNVSSEIDTTGYLCEKILPFIGSKQSTGKLAKYGNNHLRIEQSIKGGRGAYRRVEAIVRSTDSYSIEGHGLESIVTSEDYRNLGPYNAENDEVMGVTKMLLTEKEKALADTLTNTSVMTNNVTLTGTDQYSDYLNSNPIDDFSLARTTIRGLSGAVPNVAIMDWGVYNKLRFHPALLAGLGFTYQRSGGLKPDELAASMDLDQLLVANCVYNSAKEGQADVIAPIWGKSIIFAVVPASAAPYQTSLGYTVGYEGEKPRKVYKQPNFNPPDSTLILVEDNYDQFLTNVGAAYLIKNAVA